MQQASVNLYGSSNGITANRKYVRFRPSNEDQVDLLQGSELNLFDYPLDKDVVEEGDFYLQPGLGIDDIPWLYTVVDMNYTPPAGIQYEVLAQIYVPDLDVVLEQEALRISGNPINDSCIGPAAKVGKPVTNLLPNPCLNCDPICPEYPGCLGGGGGSGGGGGGTTPDPRRPAGQILVWDSHRDENLPVRQTRVIARRWFKIESMYTDDNGRFVSTKKFRNRVNIFVKFINNNLRLTRLISHPISRALFPMKRGIGIYSGNLSNITYPFPRGAATTERRYRYWWAANFMNAYLEYNTMAGNAGIGQLPTGLNCVLTRFNALGGIGATPMNNHRPWVGSFTTDYIQYYFAKPASAIGGDLFNALTNGTIFRHLDMGFGFNTGELFATNEVKDLMYHEMTHAAHFNKVGSTWWNTFVLAECYTITTPHGPYGEGNNGEASEIIGLGESWAEHIAQIFSNTQYGAFANAFKQEQGIPYSFNFPVAGLGAHLNAMEDYNPGRSYDFQHWIPYGVYYDMIDNRNDINFIRVPIIDQVLGYTNQQFFNALDNDVKSVPQFRNRLLSENGNNQQQQVLQLFSQYGY